MIGENSGEEVLSPIPQNFVDIALAKVRMETASRQHTVERPSPCKQEAPTAAAPRCEQPCCSDGDVSYFKDPSGREYKMADGKLYVKGWKDICCEARVISEKTGKVVPMAGKVIQVLGWNPIQSSDSVKDCPSEEV